jgi:hypothetical protein
MLPYYPQWSGLLRRQHRSSSSRIVRLLPNLHLDTRHISGVRTSSSIRDCVWGLTSSDGQIKTDERCRLSFCRICTPAPQIDSNRPRLEVHAVSFMAPLGNRILRNSTDYVRSTMHKTIMLADHNSRFAVIVGIAAPTT